MNEPDLHKLDPEESARRHRDFAARAIATLADSDAAISLSALDDEVMTAGLTTQHFLSALFTVSSVTINIGTNLNDPDLISAGIGRASALLLAVDLDPSFAAQALLNIANGNAALFRLEANSEPEGLDRFLVVTSP
ncbi:hypothetical protein E3N86_00855 [Cryobacterium sp. Hz7]|uniref:hypothetical protein n=1 Tax=Cryobacterium sp. Hz7 TaxID=1259166 RepID=UPI00106A535C|nr:hypothetical protein [Cryobacterium sp. Hz7]TFB66945.1 hypothetical protein E3N86_00855 [Cryobacterium sp. Hz7]